MKPRALERSLIILLLFLLGPSAFFPPTPLLAAAVDPANLPEDLQALRIQEDYVASAFETVGVIHTLEGKVVVVHRADRTAYLGSEGDPVHENDEFYTLPGSRCRIRFAHEDVISLAPETRFNVEAYSSQEAQGEKSSLFSVLKGKAMFYAMRLFQFKKMRFEVKTPTAVMGVRGTKFGVHVYRVDEQTAQHRGVRVADSGNGLGLYLAQDQGGTWVTEAACGDGSLDVNGTTLGPGEYYNSYTGTVGYDPTVLNGIENSTGDGPGGTGGTGGGTGGTGGTGGGTGSTGGTGGGTGGAGGNGGTGGDMTGMVTDVTNTQTGTGTQQGGTGGGDTGTGGDSGSGTGDGNGSQTPSEPSSGYFSALLTRSYEGTELRDVFISKVPNEFGAGDHRADSVSDSDYLLWNGQYTYVTTNGTGQDIAVGTTATTASSSSDYSYLSYGVWTHNEPSFPDGGLGTNAFVNPSWWLQGNPTPEAAMATQTGCVYYSGEAFGTMAYGSNSVSLGGNFSATADFDTGNFVDFDLDVSDGAGHSASIWNAGGAIDPDGTFDVTGGAWQCARPGDPGEAISPGHKGAHGRFFGPNADEVGGDWAMRGYFQSVGQEVGAAGVFAGKKSACPAD